jgi:hypothetical protein
MASDPKLLTHAVIAFDDFWTWLQGHPNCILAVATPDAVLYDHDSFHWQFATGEESGRLIQLILGKSVVGEVVIAAREVAYVQVEPQGEGEFAFDCISLVDGEPVAAYTISMSHEYLPEVPAKSGGIVH